MPDILFILVLALVIFGPKKLPEVMRQVAKFMAQFRMMSDDLKRQIQSEIVKIELEEKQKTVAAPQPPSAAGIPSGTVVQPPPSLDGNLPAAG
jgi:sec-independent protein translocase protein TatB